MTVNAITDTKKGRTGIAPTYLHTTQLVYWRTVSKLNTMDTQNQANPWISDKSFGSVGHALQCAEEIGVIRKV